MWASNRKVRKSSARADQFFPVNSLHSNVSHAEAPLPFKMTPACGRRNYLCRSVFDLETRGDWMNKIFAIAFTLLLTSGLALAQTSGDREKKTAKEQKKSTTATPADKVALNPQPLPPKERKAGGDPASKVALNPQPLPPKERKAGGESAESKVALNPQPEPPGVQSANKKKNVDAGKKKTPAPATSTK